MKKAIYVVLCTIIAIGLSFTTISVFAENDETITNVSKADPVSTKTFTVTKYPIADSSNETLVGEYDTFHNAIEACKQEDLSNQYVVTMNKDCNIPATEGAWGKSSVNILLKSREGHTFTLKRLGDHDIMTVYSKCTFRIENVILDGNNDGQACMVAGGDDPKGANLILGKGAVIQNFKDIPNYLGTTFYLAEGNSILTIEDGAVLQNNTAKESGGIIQGRGGTIINIKGGLFKNNSSKSGGGVLFTNGKLNITGGTFENNQGKYGGALWIGSKSTATVENATFRNNKTTSSYGGAIWGSNEFKVKNSTFEKNQAKWGGAIYSQKNMTIEGSTFKENEADAGGALAILDEMKMTVKDSKFIGNSATFAGAIYIRTSTEESTMSGCNFTDNEATAKGGAIWSDNAPISIEDSTFQNNGNGTKYGGGLCVNGPKTYNVQNSTFKGNKAKLGGGIFVAGGKLSVEGTTLESNIAETEKNQQGNISKGVGGAILSLKNEDTNSEMVISKSKIKNNEALNGAGVTVQSGNVEIKDTEFNGNDTKGPEDDQDKRLGGALYVDVDANVNISDESKFIGNKAGLGGAIFDASADYSNPADISKYRNLKIEGTTLFKGNEARTGLHQPPINFEKFDNLLFSEKSDVPHDKYMSKSLLNNYDINYQGGLLITYDANGGKFTDDESIKQELHKENDTITIIEAPMREGYQFLYWKGSKYNPGDSYIVKDNHAFVAQWNKIPELEVKDATITQGDDFNLKSLVVKATDEEDGDLTKDVKI
ncbi:MAG: InlB B-repeat-containing protein, partial [Clostridiales bacterium]|nr:InlB B-repeat-containing protein [Clostridiales bacterium]MDU3490888.1 InlB B-repeat-containing protein [Clostridiales bacterium]